MVCTYHQCLRAVFKVKNNITVNSAVCVSETRTLGAIAPPAVAAARLIFVQFTAQILQILFLFCLVKFS